MMMEFHAAGGGKDSWMSNDLGLARLTSAISAEGIHPVKLVGYETKLDDKMDLIMAGWGHNDNSRAYPKKLLKSHVFLQPSTNCLRTAQYGKKYVFLR